MQNNNNTNSDNQTNQSPNRRKRQAKKPTAKKPDERTDEAGYQKLSHDYRPLAGRAQRDPLDYDSHPYPSMLRYRIPVKLIYCCGLRVSECLAQSLSLQSLPTSCPARVVASL